LHAPSHEHRRRARTIEKHHRESNESIKPLNKKKGSAKPAATEDIFDPPISDCEIQAAIKQLKNRKSP